MSERYPTLKELLSDLNGREFYSSWQEDVIGIEGDSFWKLGVKKKIPRNKIKELWDDYITSEFGSKQRMIAMGEAEFGKERVRGYSK